MKTLFYIHFNKEELEEKLKPLKNLKLKLLSHYSTEETAQWGEQLPDIFVISLNRLPSHGRQYAQWIWEAKKRQHIPIIFTDGQPDKVEATLAKFPNARYCTSEQLHGLLTGMIN
jgi:response regulator RpfG family c-di-GMP phosphodiesterase